MNDHDALIRAIGYLEGKMAGIRDYAIWRNGCQYVGVLQKPLGEVLQPYKEELARLDARLATENQEARATTQPSVPQSLTAN